MMPADVAAAFAAIPAGARGVLRGVRTRLFALADEHAVGPLTETLKWGEPAYLTEATGAGTTVRLGLVGGDPAVLVHCQTTLVEGYRSDLPDAFLYSGNRAVLVAAGSDPAALDIVLSRALTYRRAKRGGA